MKNESGVSQAHFLNGVKKFNFMYVFNHEEIIKHPLHQIEYSIIDSCNRNCVSCSHFSPLVKSANEITVEEFVKNTEILYSQIPDVRTFWLIGGEPTLHPKYLEILRELRRIYKDIPVGIMSNGYGILAKRNDPEFWKFIKGNEIVWRITTYDIDPNFYQELFDKYDCLDFLSLDRNNRFTKLAVLTKEPQEISDSKYADCGWERLNIFVRNGRIWKCPSVEYIDLFNSYFNEIFEISKDDYLDINENLTRKQIIEFNRKPSSFCAYCNITKRFKETFEVTKSKKKKSEWMVDK